MRFPEGRGCPRERGWECNWLGSCLKAHLKNSRKSSNCDCTLASMCVRAYTRTHAHNTHCHFGFPPLEEPVPHQWEFMKGGAVQVNGAKNANDWRAVWRHTSRTNCWLHSSQRVRTHHTHCHYDILNALVLCLWSVWILSTSSHPVWIPCKGMNVCNNCERRQAITYAVIYF